VNINWAAVIVSAIVLFIIGAVWYSPMLFGKKWAELRGATPPSGPPPPANIVTALAGSFITALVFAYIFSITTASPSVGGGAILGALFWIGFYAPVSAIMGMFEGRPFALWLVNNAQSLISLVVIGCIIGAWH
jgi:hypothetical protein